MNEKQTECSVIFITKYLFCELCCLWLLGNITVQNVYMHIHLVAATLSVKKSVGKCRWSMSSSKTSSVHYIVKIQVVVTWDPYNTMEYNDTFISLTKAHILNRVWLGYNVLLLYYYIFLLLSLLQLKNLKPCGVLNHLLPTAVPPFAVMLQGSPSYFQIKIRHCTT